MVTYKLVLRFFLPRTVILSPYLDAEKAFLESPQQ